MTILRLAEEKMKITPSDIVNLIDNAFPFAKQGKSAELDFAYAGFLSGLVSLLDKLDQGFLLFLSSEDLSQFIISIEAIRLAVLGWTTPASSSIQKNLKPISSLGNKHPISIIRNCLANLPDIIPPDSSPELDFIFNDPELKSRLSMDVSYAYSAHNNKNYLGAMVLSGSIIEAILLWKIKSQPELNFEKLSNSWNERIKKSNSTFQVKIKLDPNYWVLHELANMAFEASLISEDILNEILLTKDFRNLIHPGRQVRLESVPTHGKSSISIGVLHEVIQHFGKCKIENSA